MIERRPRAPVLRRDRLARDGVQRLFLEAQLDAFHLEHALILLGQRVLRPRQNFDQRRFRQIAQRREDRQTADEFRDQAEFQQIFRLHFAQHFAGAAFVGRAHIGAEAHRRAMRARRDDLLQAGKRAAADEQDVGRVDLQEFLLRMLAAALRRHARRPCLP